MTSFPGGGTPADRIRLLWERSAGGAPPDLAALLASVNDATPADQIEAVVADAHERFSRNLPASIEHYRASIPALAAAPELVRALLMAECSHRRDRTPEELRRELLTRLPELADEIEGVIELVSLMREAATTAHEDDLDAGSVLGTYRLVEWLGAGSFGEVWCAWDTRLERYIALKLLRLPAATEDGLNRVLAEAQAAAALDHENIVKVHAAGRLGSGQCFIDCQLVGDPDPVPQDRKRVKIGTTLSASLASGDGKARPMEPRAAARTMESVCRGVAAAHARGIVHRDIKPSNIMVTPSGRPLVTDFGLSIAAPRHAANVAEPGDLSGNNPPITATVSLPSRGGSITGTPAFMSPEQAEGKPALPASDVYALGATLRFLLTGELPFQPSGKYHADARWDVVEQVRRRELRPLMELTSQAGRNIPRDLAAICDKAMRHAAGERYVSAQQMAEDLTSWLGYRPVAARPAGAGRTLALWSRRHAAPTAVAGIALILGSAGVWRYIVSIGRERDRAVAAEEATKRQLLETQQARAVSESVNSFLQGVLQAADPGILGRDVKMIDAVRFSASEISVRFKDQPRIEAQVRDTLGSTYRMLGEVTEGARELETALGIQRRELGESHRDTLWTRHALLLTRTLSNSAEIVPELRTLIDDMTRSLGADDSLTLAARMSLGIIISSQHLFAEAAVHFQAVLDAAARGSDVDIENVIKAKIELARNNFYLMRAQDSIRLMHECIADLTRLFGAEHITTLNASTILANMLMQSNGLPEAERLTQAALEGYTRRLPPGFDLTFGAARDLAEIRLLLGRPEEAAALLEPAFAPFLARPDHDPVQLPRAYEILGRSYAAAGHYAQAERALLSAREGFITLVGGEKNAVVQRVSAFLAEVYAKLGDPAKAAEYRQKAGLAPIDPAPAPR